MTSTTSAPTTASKTPVIIGLDISTTCTGISVINRDTGDLLSMHHELMNNPKKFPDFWDKIAHMSTALGLICSNPSWQIEGVAVEENAKRFTPGFSSADTIITLAKFNGILCYIMFLKYGLKPININVRSARSKLGIKINYKDKSKPTKQKVLEHLVNAHPNFPWIYKTSKDGVQSLTKINEDRADSYVIAEAARLMHFIP